MRYKGYKNMERLPGPQPASLSRNSLETLRTRPFMVLEKSDGERCTSEEIHLTTTVDCFADTPS